MALLSLAACGRIGYDPFGDGTADAGRDGAANDASADGAVATGTPTVVAAMALGGPDIELVSAVAVDGTGNPIVGGRFLGDVDYGGGPWSARGPGDAYVLAMTPALAHRWSFTYGGSGSDGVSDIAVAPSGEVYWIGQFQGTADAGTGVLTSAGGDDWMFGARDGASGAPLWTGQAASPGDDDIGGRLGLHPSGGVYVAGTYSGRVDVGTVSADSAGDRDVFLADVDGGGNARSIASVGGTARDVSAGLGIARPSGAYLGVAFQGDVVADAETASSAGGLDFSLTAYDATGGVRWLRTVGGPLDDRPEETTGHPSGGAVICGRFQDGFTVGRIPVRSGGLDDALVVRYDDAGAVLWAWTAGSSGADAIEACTVDELGRVYVIGSFEGTVDFGDASHTSAGGEDLFLASIDDSGATRWSLRFGAEGDDKAENITVDRPDSVWAVGGFSGSADLDGIPLVSDGPQDGLLVHVVVR